MLRDAGHEVVDLAGAAREKLLAELADADALLVRSATQVDAALLEAAPRLTVVGRAGVGVDNVDVPAASARGVLVLNSPTGNVVSAVEHTFAVLLALLRRVPEASASMAAGKWEKAKFLGSELSGKTVGIVGLGQVGSRVASRARAFEARLLGHDPFLPLEKAQEMGVPLVPLETLLEQSDVVTLHSTATDKGRPLLGAEEIARMKPGAVLVNVARGSLVDRTALYDALAGGRLAGAALDVFDPEPPDPQRSAPQAPERRRDTAPGRVHGRGAGARLDPDGRGAARGARRRALRAGRQPALPRAEGRGRAPRAGCASPSARRTSCPW